MKKLGFRIWLYIIVLVLAIMSIFVSSSGIAFFQKGVLITSVEQNSSAFEAGLRQGQIITEINNQKIEDIQSFSEYIQKTFPSEQEIKVVIKTKDSEAILYTKYAPNITVSSIP